MSNRKCILSSIVPLKFIYEIFVTNRNVSARLTLHLPTNFSQSRNKSIKVDESCLLRVKLTKQSLPQKAVKWKILKKCLLINTLSCSSDSTSTKINRTKRIIQFEFTVWSVRQILPSFLQKVDFIRIKTICCELNCSTLSFSFLRRPEK